MPTRSLNVLISGDAKPLGAATRQADAHMERMGSTASRVVKGMALGFATAGAAAAGILVVGLKKSVEAATDAQKSQVKLEAQLKASGISYRAHAKEIDNVIQKHSRLAGVDDEDLQDAFTGILRTTNSVSVAMKDMGLVTDLMRARNLSAAKAGDLLAKVHAGNVGALKRLGIAMQPVTAAQDKLKESNKGAAAWQVRAAKETDKTATSQRALASLQEHFAGQADAYGKTAAGAQERFGVAVENLQEKIGARFLPVLASVTNKVATFVGGMESGTGVGGRFADRVSEAFNRVKTAVQSALPTAVAVFERLRAAVTSVVSTVSGLVRGFQAGKGGAVAIVAAVTGLVAAFGTAVVIVKTVTAVTKAWTIAQAALDVVLSANPIGLVVVAIAGLAAGLVVAYKKSETFRNIVNGTWDAIKSAAQTVFPIIKKMMSLGLLGPIGLAITHFGTLKRIASSVWGALQSTAEAVFPIVKKLVSVGLIDPLKLVVANFGTIKRVASTAWGAIKTGADAVVKSVQAVGSAFGAVAGVVKKVGGALNPFGDGIGMSLPGGAGLSGGNGLMGAKQIMAPFASMAGRFGLHTSSGARPGAITSSGNVSWHSSGNAIDEAGSPAGMLGYFRYLKNTFGSRLRELIYTPGGVGIKDGRPYQYTGQVAADHYDHVHVAFTGDGHGRKAGTGDGLGRFDATSYGPPWGGIQGGGVTATGVNLKGNPHIYGVAVDPRVIPLGSKLRINPNPFGYSGPFTAFDTGGAIKGNRIDFYDWRGRTAQNGWGHRNVSVSTYSGGGSSGSGGSSSGGSGGSSKPRTGSSGGPPPTVDNKAIYGVTESTIPTFANTFGTPPVKGRGDFPGAPHKGGATLNPDGTDPRQVARDLAAAGPSEFDYLDLALANAEATTGTDDDRSALTAIRDYRARALNAATATGDPRQIATARRDLTSAESALTQLTDALTDTATAIKAQTDALTAVQAELQRQTDVATSIQSTEAFQLKRYLADVLSGEFGRGIVARSFTAGTGVEVAY